MKKVVNLLSILGIVVAPCAIAPLYFQETPASELLNSSTPQITHVEQPEAFPLNQTRFVDFQADPGSLERLTKREQMDQLRDWLLFTVVSNQGLSTDELTQSLYDLPTIRYGYTKPVSNFEYGRTRSLYIGKGKVVALLPKGLSETERLDELAHIADKHRKNIGQIPTFLEVFEYEINPEQKFAQLTRKEVLDAQKLFIKGENGYYEAQIKSLENLQDFLNQVEDVTYAQVKGSSLILGGRQLLSRDYQGIDLEDVAAIWQSEKKIQARLADFEARWLKKLNTLPSHLYQEGLQQAREEQRQLKLVNGSGFSLDPGYDYRSLENFLSQIEPVLQTLTLEDASAITKQDIEKARLGLAKDDVVPYLVLADKLTKSDNPRISVVGELASAAEIKYRYQAARYDGELQGTEVGMVLFYTDLLAKLWALDYLSTTPEDKIQDFKALTKVKISSIYEQEEQELPYTRLWFGVQDKGFQVANQGKSIVFGRNATRIYAASSNPLQPGVEKTASASSEAFLGWWNDHYEEVARYEPEYERLNEIMKWSLLISWLNESDQGEILSFLQGVEVRRNLWFPNWAQENSRRLRFKNWSKVGFFERGYQDSKTEAMPILFSEPYKKFGKIGGLSGGVSLANKNLFKGRATLPSNNKISQLFRRSYLDYDSVKSIGKSLKLKTLGGKEYYFHLAPDVNLVAAKAKPTAKFRSPESELANSTFNRKISSTDSKLEISTDVDGIELGSFSTTKTENGFTVGWRSLDIAEGQNLAWKLSQSPRNKAEQIISQDPLVKSLRKLSDQEGYLVEMHGSKRWLKLSSDGGGNPNIPPGWHSRVGSPDDGSGNNFLLKWVDEKTVKKQILQGKVVFIIDEKNKINRKKYQDILEDLREQEYKYIAKELANNPSGTSRILRKHLTDGVKQVDGLLNSNNYLKAQHNIQRLIRLHGKRPKLMFRKAVALIGEGRLKVTPIHPNIGQKQGRINFFDQVNVLLKHTDSEVKFDEFKAKDALAYVQDFPGFNQLDPNSPFEESIPQIPVTYRVYRLEPGDIGGAKASTAGSG
ncbi:MAG: hypothetical protein F6K55_09745, partial [Moorea sp. SIO4A3]|nr:hypothetical protein [Moorena sp. SIO4A3]